MPDRYTTSMLEGLYVCPSCLAAGAAALKCGECGWRGDLVERHADEVPSRALAVGRPPLLPRLAALVMALFGEAVLVGGGASALLRTIQGREIPEESLARWATWAGAGLFVLFVAGTIGHVTRDMRRREVTADADGLVQAGPGKRHTRIAWHNVEVCQFATSTVGNVDLDVGLTGELLVSDGTRQIRIWQSMPGYDAVKRTILTFTPVLTPLGPNARWPRHRIVAWVAIAMVLFLGTGLVVWWAMKWV